MVRAALIILAVAAVGTLYSKYQGSADAPSPVEALPPSVAPAPAVQIEPLVTAASSATERRAAAQRLLASGMVTTVTRQSDPDINCDSQADLRQHADQLYWKGLAFLQRIVKAGFKVRVSCIKTGHVADNLLHPRWKAVDVDMIENDAGKLELVRPNSAAAAKFARWLNKLADTKGGLKQLPYEIGGPKNLVNHQLVKEVGSDRRGPFFWDNTSPDLGHNNHFHLGFECIPGRSKDFRDCFSNSPQSTLAKAYARAPWM
jgi:hypothetical protein